MPAIATSEPSTPESTARVRQLADRLGFIADPDFALLAGVTEKTTETWRKRHTGPAYTLIGNRYFYPETAVAAYMMAKVRQRGQASAKDQL